MLTIKNGYLSIMVFFLGIFLEILVMNLGWKYGAHRMPNEISKIFEICVYLIQSLFVFGIYSGISMSIKKKRWPIPCIVGIFLNGIWLLFIGAIWIAVSIFGISA